MKWKPIWALYVTVFIVLFAVTVVWIGVHFDRDRNSFVSSMRSCENRTAFCPFKGLEIERNADGSFRGFQVTFRAGRGAVIFDTYRLAETYNSRPINEANQTQIRSFMSAKTPAREAYRRVEIAGHSDIFAVKRLKGNCNVNLAAGPQTTVVQPVLSVSLDECLARLRAIEFAEALRPFARYHEGDEEEVAFSTDRFMLSTDRLFDGLLNEAFEIVSLRNFLVAKAHADLDVPTERVLSPEQFQQWLDSHRAEYEDRLRPFRSVVARIRECYTERCLDG